MIRRTEEGHRNPVLPGHSLRASTKNPSAGVTGTTERTVSKGGYVGVLACKFYAGHKRHGQHVAITWNATTISITDATGQMIASYAIPSQPGGWHGPAEGQPPTMP